MTKRNNVENQWFDLEEENDICDETTLIERNTSTLEQLLVKLIRYRENDPAESHRSCSAAHTQETAEVQETTIVTSDHRSAKHHVSKKSKKRARVLSILYNRSSRSSRPSIKIKRKVLTPLSKTSSSSRSGLLVNDCLAPHIRSQLHLYVERICDMYRYVKFHNFQHASHVTLSASKLVDLLVSCKSFSNNDDKELDSTTSEQEKDSTFGLISDPLTHFALVFSALIHDVDHTGLTNKHHVEKADKLARTYNCLSVAENRSIDVGLLILSDTAFKDLRDCIYNTPEEREQFHQVIFDAIMCTDISCPKQRMIGKKKWEVAFPLKDDETQSTTSDGQSASKDRTIPYRRPQSVSSMCRTDSQESIDVFESCDEGEEYYSVSESPEANRTLKAGIVIELLIQVADISHTMQDWSLFLKWNKHLYEELMCACRKSCGGDPTDGWYSGEIGFFNGYIIPLASKLRDCGVFGIVGDMFVQQAIRNKERWMREGKEITQAMIEEHKRMYDSIQ